MRIGAIPESPRDLMALVAGLAPRPVIETLLSAVLCRTLVTATRVGVFDALDDGPLGADEVAERCGTNGSATTKLLGALVGSGYLVVEGGRYSMAPVAKKWLPRDREQSLHAHMELMAVVWRWLDGFDGFIRTGKPLDVHGTLSEGEWGSYQRGMRSLATLLAPEVARRTDVPRGARDMLDVGGSHGLFSVALCRKHPGLRSTVLDLPEAVAHASELLAAEDMGDRVTHRGGNVLEDDLGEECYDLIFMANVVHHFSEEQNVDLMRRVSRSLRPGGTVVVQELARPTIDRPTQAEALGDVYFALTSASGLWTFEEIASWQRASGLTTKRPIRFVTYPGAGQQSALKRE